jgi:hypothetical protein
MVWSVALDAISATILDEASSPDQLRAALQQFAQLCGDHTGIAPDPSFDGWAGDTFLAGGVAINPQAAAHCVNDIQRSVVFMRGVFAAIQSCRQQFVSEPVRILYAGCGPSATLLMPLLHKLSPDELEICLLDIHEESLASVEQLISHFALDDYRVQTLLGDACTYQHPTALHLVIAETMQKSLEQEPQFAVTANLAPQLISGGIFIPEKIAVRVCLVRTDTQQRSEPGEAVALAALFTLLPGQAAAQLRNAGYNQHTAKFELNSVEFEIPCRQDLDSFEAVMFTRIQVFDQYQLGDYEAEITLPQRCRELAPLRGGDCYRASYQLGNYPRFNFAVLPSVS